MSRVEVTINGDLPDNLQVGDVFPVTASARVIGVEEELIDVSGHGQARGSVVLPGERIVRVLVTLDGRMA